MLYINIYTYTYEDARKEKLKLERIQRVQPQKTKKKQSMAIKASDSTTVTTVQATFSIIEKPKNPKLCKLHPVVKYDMSNSGHRNTDDSKDRSNSSHRKAEVYHLVGHISIICVTSLCVGDYS